MSLGPDEDPFHTTDHNLSISSGSRPAVSHRGQLVRGIVVAMACDTVFNIPWVFLRSVLKPENVANAIESLLLGVNMLVGYVGGRTAVRAGLAYDDTRAQWTMAWMVCMLSHLVTVGTQRVQTLLRVGRLPELASQHVPLESSLAFLVVFAASVLLVRFGFAMGTYSQAKRAGRVHEEDETSLD